MYAVQALPTTKVNSFDTDVDTCNFLATVMPAEQPMPKMCLLRLYKLFLKLEVAEKLAN